MESLSLEIAVQPSAAHDRVHRRLTAPAADPRSSSLRAPGHALTAKPPSWSTSSFGHTADTSADDLLTLGTHLHMCRGVTGRLFALQCGGESVHRFLASRIVTTLLAATLLIGGAVLAF